MYMNIIVAVLDAINRAVFFKKCHHPEATRPHVPTEPLSWSQCMEYIHNYDTCTINVLDKYLPK